MTDYYSFKENFFDKPLDPQEIAELKIRALPSIKHHIRHYELANANNSVVQSRRVVNELKAEINEAKDDIEQMNEIAEGIKVKVGVEGWLENAKDLIKHNRIVLHLQNLTLLQFKKKEIIYSWIYKGNKAEVERRLTPYKEAIGECFEYFEEHTDKLGLTIQTGDPNSTVGDYEGDKSKDENIRQIGKQLQTEANKVENFYKICC